jgi:hypothetical protein
MLQQPRYRGGNNGLDRRTRKSLKNTTNLINKEFIFHFCFDIGCCFDYLIPSTKSLDILKVEMYTEAL